MTTATITVVSSGLPRATKGAAWGRKAARCLDVRIQILGTKPKSDLSKMGLEFCQLTCFFTNENTLKGFATQLLMSNLHQLIWRWLIWVVRAGFPISQPSFCLPSIWLLHCDSLSLKNTCRYLHGLSCVVSWFMSRILEMPPEKKMLYCTLTVCFWHPRHPTTFAFKMSRDDE